jgi:glycosyltransferase involved in cell wall biosynthesis
MHLALSYSYYAFAQNDYLEERLHQLDQTITFIGPPTTYKPGYSGRTVLNELFSIWTRPPDCYLAIDPGERFFPPGVEDLPIPTVCWLGDVHLGRWREDVAQFFDVVFVPHLDYVARYREIVGHEQVYWLPWYVPDLVRPVPQLERLYEVGFVGSNVRPHRRTPRARRLRMLGQHFRMNDRSISVDHAGLARVYSQSKIVVNITINGDINLRLFEGTACGALLLTDSRANGIEQLFDLGHEVIVYDSDQELLDQINYYLAHEDERSQIAEAGQQRCLRDHTFTRRAEQLLGYLDGPIVRCAPMRTASAKERRALRRRIYTHMYTLDPILDEDSAARVNPLQRMWDVAPALVRRLLI